MLIYVSHPYGGKEENKKAAAKIVDELRTGKNSTQKHRLITILTPDSDPCFGLVRAGIKSNSLMGETFVSPIHQLGAMYDDMSYIQGLNQCLELLNKCDSIFLCDGWKESKGCISEYAFARAMRIPIIFENPGDIYDFSTGY